MSIRSNNGAKRFTKAMVNSLSQPICIPKYILKYKKKWSIDKYDRKIKEHKQKIKTERINFVLGGSGAKFMQDYCDIFNKDENALFTKILQFNK